MTVKTITKRNFNSDNCFRQNGIGDCFSDTDKLPYHQAVKVDIREHAVLTPAGVEMTSTAYSLATAYITRFISSLRSLQAIKLVQGSLLCKSLRFNLHNHIVYTCPRVLMQKCNNHCVQSKPGKQKVTHAVW